MGLYTGPDGILPLSGAGGTAGNGEWQVWNNAAGTSANFMLGGPLTGAPIVCTDGDAVQFLGGSPGALVITCT